MPSDSQSANLSVLLEGTQTFDSFTVDSAEAIVVRSNGVLFTEGSFGLIVFNLCVSTSKSSCCSRVNDETKPARTSDQMIVLIGLLAVALQ